MNVRFRQVAAITTALTVGLILIGVYTKAMGAGLTCAGRWPLCDGWLGLFPANWASFIEWFHRFVAMVVGFMIVGLTAGAYWNGHEDRIVYASIVAVVVLPIQVLLGANTIMSYGPTAQVAHHAAALVILVALVLVTAWAYDEGH